MMSEIVIRLGKRRAIYLPSKVARELGISEGDPLILKVEEGRIVLTPLPKLLVKRRKWAKTTLEEFEKESESLTEEMERE